MGLNPEQQQAVETLRGPLLLLAGAGSGKTRVVTVRIARLIQVGILPDQILAVTFTNKAAREMAERLGGLVSKEAAKRVKVCTFHRLGLDILREFGKQCGLSAGFTILDADDQGALIRECMREEKVNLERYEVSWFRNRISALKNDGTLPGTRDIRVTDVIGQLVERVYARYSDLLTSMNAVDFDDLLLRPLKLMETSPSIQTKLQHRFRYIHVDEFQDTNGVQMDFLRCLAREHQNICVVGDDDQSIYGWRGARIENVLSFEQEFPTAKVIKLTQNYRSSGAILEAANAVIQNNTVRRAKELWTSSSYGAPVRYLCVNEPEEEASWIAKKVEAAILERGKQPGLIGVLFRTNSQSRALEQALHERKIRFQLVGGLTFYDRKEVKDAIGYLRWLTNPDDELALRRVLAFPSRGIGDGSIHRLLEYCRAQRMRLGQFFETAGFDMVPGISQRAMKGLRELGELTDIRQAVQLEAGKAVDAFGSCLERVGFRSALLHGSKTQEEGRRKWENVEELLASFRRFEDRRGGSVTGSELLHELSLNQQDTGEEDEEPTVTLMSLHASKGLEFPIVFLPGLEESLLPHWRSLETGDVTEERRLFYVGITRAKEELYLLGCRTRRQFKKTIHCKKSRFIEELPTSVTEGSGPTEVSEEEAHQAAMAQLAYLFEDGSDTSTP